MKTGSEPVAAGSFRPQVPISGAEAGLMFLCQRCRAACILTAVRCRICGQRQSRLRTMMLPLFCAGLMVGTGCLIVAWL
jgi:hypothetical protein